LKNVETERSSPAGCPAWIDDADRELEFVADDLNRQNEIRVVRNHDSDLVATPESVRQQQRR